MADVGSGVQAGLDAASKSIDLSGVGPNTIEGLQAGMGLAERRQKLQQDQQDLQFKQEQHTIMKSDWVHDQFQKIASAPDKETALAYVDNYEKTAPQVLGQRPDPSQINLMRAQAGKVTSYSNAMIASATINDYIKNPQLYGDQADQAHQHQLAWARETLNHTGRNAADALDAMRPIEQMKAMMEATIQRAAATEKVVTPAVAAAAGKTQADAQATANAANPSMARTQLRKDDQSVKAGQDFERDPIITANVKSENSLDRAVSIINNPDKPLLKSDMNLAFNDYINAVAAGGVATEGKIARELPETWATDWNGLKAKAGEFDDLRKDPVGKQLSEILGKNISKVKEDLENASSGRAEAIYGNYAAHSNPAVRRIAQQKLKLHAPDKYAALVKSGKLHPEPEEQEAPEIQTAAPAPTPAPTPSSAPSAAEPQAAGATPNPAPNPSTSPVLPGLKDEKTERENALRAIDLIKKSPPGTYPVTEDVLRKRFKAIYHRDL